MQSISGLKTFFISIALIFFSEARRQRSEEHRISRIHEFDNCKDRPLRPYHFLRRQISLHDRTDYFLNADGVCDKSTKTIEQVVVNVTKCADRTKSKCEYMRRLEWKPSAVICPLFSLRGTPWDTVLEAFSPRLRCTNPKGPFTVRNMTFAVKGMSNMQIEGNDYYVATYEFFDEKHSPWLCFHAEADYPLVRAKKLK